MSENNSMQESKRPRINLSGLREIPWWVVILVLIGVSFLIIVFTNQNYQETMLVLIKGRPTASALEGLLLTVRITLVSFAIAVTIGLFMEVQYLLMK